MTRLCHTMKPWLIEGPRVYSVKVIAKEKCSTGGVIVRCTPVFVFVCAGNVCSVFPTCRGNDSMVPMVLFYSISVFLLFSTLKSCSFARDGLRFAANLPFFPPLLAIGWSWEGHLSRIAAAWGQWRTYEVIGRWINSCNYISIPGLKFWAFVPFPLFDRERWWWWGRIWYIK